MITASDSSRFASRPRNCQSPSTETSVIGIIRDEKGMTPDVFDCLGKENGWYKIRFGGKVAYVRCDLMEWDAINSF